MRELLAKLNEKGIYVTERMVRHYTSIGLLHKPKQPYPNQAIYDDVHLSLLEVIDNNKKMGYSLGEIKEALLSTINKYIKEQELLNTDDGAERIRDHWNDVLNLKSTSKQEWRNIHKENNLHFYTVSEMLEEAGCDEAFLKTAFSLKILDDKKYYDFAEMHLLRAFHNFINIGPKRYGQNFNEIPTELILHLTKAIELANEIADFTTGTFNSWTYSDLLQSILFLKAREKSYNAESPDDGIWSWDDKEMGPGQFPDSDDEGNNDYWSKFYEAMESQGVDLKEFFLDKSEELDLDTLTDLDLDQLEETEQDELIFEED